MSIPTYISKREQYNLNPKQCKECCNTIAYEKRFNNFCSQSCSTTFNNKRRPPRTVESREKTAHSLIKHGELFGFPAPTPPEKLRYCSLHFHECSHCGKYMTNPYRKTCSTECRDSTRSVNGTLKRRVQWEGYTFQSNWEVEVAKLLTKLEIVWEQPTKRIRWFDTTQKKNRTYLPDFFLVDSGVFLDVKNKFKQESDYDKLSQLKKLIPLVVGDLVEIKSFLLTL
jgi:hypothetical protein